jgi:uncharacterized membrane protein (DUF2068 family)
MTKTGQHHGALRLIAIFKILKATLLILVGLGAHHLLHKDVAQVVESWTKALKIDPDNRHLAGLLGKANLVNDRKLETLSWLTFAYAALFLTEGTGLFLQKRWAEYLTIVATASFVPLEIYEICKHLSAVKIGVLIINMAILIYLIVSVRRKAREQQ